MNDPHFDGDSPGEPQTLHRIDMACDAYESSWLAGGRGNLAEHLESAAEADRPKLMAELLAMEVEYRRRQGELPTAAEYAVRFPAYLRQIEQVFPAPATRVAAEQPTPPARQLLPTSLHIERTLGVYQLLEKLGEGGMGTVYRARHTKLKRMVAVKILPDEALSNPDSIARFEREMQVVGALDHAHIVRAMDAGFLDRTHFLVMEYVKGTDLGKLLRTTGPLPWKQAVDYVCQAAEGLAYVHRQRVVHRDIKPANLLLSETGVVKVSDLGLARLESEFVQQSTALALTQFNQVLGTFDFMSPEQAVQSREVDHRTDIYSLGCTLYVLITGKPIFEEASSVEKVMAHRTKPAPSLRDSGIKVPAALDAIYLRTVAKDPNDRFQHMEELGEALKAVVAGKSLPPTAKGLAETQFLPAAPPAQQATPKQSRRKFYVAAFGLLSLLLGGLLAWGAMGLRGSGHIGFDAYDSEIELELLRSGEVIETFTAGEKNHPGRYPAGEYQVRLRDPSPRTQLEGDRFTLGAGQRHWVHIRRIALPEFLRSQQWEWTTPQVVPGLNSPQRDAGATLTSDGLLIVFESNREGGRGGNDLWQATRASPTQPWSNIRNLPAGVNSSQEEQLPELSGDGLTLIFSSNRPGGVGGSDLWITSRAERDANWSLPRNLGRAINSSADELGCALASNGLDLIYASKKNSDIDKFSFWEAARNSASEPFGSAKRLDHDAFASSITVTPRFVDNNDNALLFGSFRLGGAGRSDLWITFRDSASGQWQAAMNLGAVVNSAGNELPAALTNDGTSLYLEAYDYPDSVGGSDIYFSQRMSAAAVSNLKQQPKRELPPALLAESKPSPNEPQQDEPTQDLSHPPLAIAPLDTQAAIAHQQAWATHLDVPVEKTVQLGGVTPMRFVLIPPGEYWRGSTVDDVKRLQPTVDKLGGDSAHHMYLNHELPRHLVTITKPFYLGQCEMTRGNWQALVPPETVDEEKLDYPMANVTCDEVDVMLATLNEYHLPLGVSVELPTEAQWEYACRAGTTSEYWFGDDPRALTGHEWVQGSRPYGPQPVGSLIPNPWGLFDMQGNVSEWLADWYDADFYAVSGRYDPSGPLERTFTRCHRGGSYRTSELWSRSADRDAFRPAASHDSIGLRLMTRQVKVLAKAE